MNTQLTRSASPTKPVVEPIGKSETMNFFDALKEVLAGKKIHKLEWEDKGFYGYIKDAILTLHKPEGTDHGWIITDGDMVGTDFIVL